MLREHSNSTGWLLKSLSALLALSVFGVAHAAKSEKPKDFGPDVVIGEVDCDLVALGTTIPIRKIGEPVSGVTLDEAEWVAATDSSPAYCRVNGSMTPIDPESLNINFSVALPATWTRRYVQQGGGGNNGSIPRGFPSADYLARGYAVAGSDSGHQGDPDEWTLTDEALKNFGYMQMKKTRDAAQVLMWRMYKSKPAYAYWVGNSQGGREGLTVAQRYPKDFDGVLVTVPVVGFSTLTLSRALQKIQEITYRNWVTPDKTETIATEVIRQCDGLDGVTDGIVNNYMGCRSQFNPSELLCEYEENSACLTEGQVETVEFTYSPYRYATPLANGTKDFGMYLPSTDAAGGRGRLFITGNRYWYQEDKDENGDIFNIAEGDPEYQRWYWRAYKFVAGGLWKDITRDSLTYIEGHDTHRRKKLSQWLDSTNPNLNPFRANGGKLISYVGTFDTTAAPGEQLDYYQSILDRMGTRKVRSFARLYVLPNTGHGLSGSQYHVDGDGNDIVDGRSIPNSGSPRFDALVDWVENGVAPDDESPPVVTTSDGTASLPLCEYPAYPHYVAGDPAHADSYRCEKNDDDFDDDDEEEEDEDDD